MSRNRNRKRIYFFSPPSISVSHSLCRSICSLLSKGFSPPLSALPLSSFLHPLLPLSQGLTQIRNSISFQRDWLMLSDLDFMWAGSISVLVLSGLVLYLHTSTRAKVTVFLTFTFDLLVSPLTSQTMWKQKENETMVAMVMVL